jgi:riboflavin kinase/FMN adenylyltransferase
MHLGHRSIVSLASTICKEQNLINAIFTFSGFFKKGNGQVYSLDERKKLYAQCGIESVIVYEFNNRIKNLSAKQFLDELISAYKIRAFVCGKDYRFGYNASGDVNFLREYCESKNIQLFVADDIIVDGHKVSSTQIKDLLEEGKIEKANELLGSKYFIRESVVHGRGEGHLFGIPTANIKIDEERIYPKEGVYATTIEIDGKRYQAVTNIGAKPTFFDKTRSIESFIVNFDGNIYGETVTLSFHKRLRDIIVFDSVDALKERIMLDSKWEE